jgi:ATP-dependent RNA helicase RhlE
MSFQSLGLSSLFVNLLATNNITKPTPIQAKAIPTILEGKDVLGIAKTGSGKTASFALPILANLEKSEGLKNRHVNVLVLVPTRELAVQVHEVFQTYGQATKVRIKSLAVYGGVAINPQMQKLQNVNVLIATPGRLLELVEKNATSLRSIETLVLEEADKMLNLGFKEEMDKIFALLPKKRQNLLFSATLSEDVANIESVLLKNPLVIKIKEEEKEEENLIKQLAYYCKEEEKGPLLRYIIKENKFKQVLVFASSTYKADNIADKLRKNRIDAQAIHGKKSQGARLSALQRFKDGQLRVLVATDILARGIDIEYLPCVINYELPRSPKDYVHRIGRTGRAGETGEAFSLITEESAHHFKVIQKKMKKQVEMIDAETIDLHGA